MASIQDSVFTDFAGQLVASGVRPNAPIIALEDESTRTKLNNLSLINGMIPKISDVIIHDTRVWGDPLNPYFRKYGGRFGVATEHAGFATGAANKLNEGKCMPRGSVDMASQVNINNYAYDVEIEVKDHEVDGALMNDGQLASYISAKLKTPLKTMAAEHYAAEVQLLSDVIDGTRSISSTTSSQTSATSVTYSATVKGYAGKVVNSNTVVPEITLGSNPSFASSAAAVGIVKTLRGAARDMKVESDDYNVLGIDTFLVDKPLLIMEEKVLDGLDAAMSLDTDGRFPSTTAREFLGTFADIVEIPSFAALPTTADPDYADTRLGAVLLDREALSEKVAYQDVESFRCVSGRSTGYSFQGKSTLEIYKGVPSYALLFSTS